MIIWPERDAGHAVVGIELGCVPVTDGQLAVLIMEELHIECMSE